MIINRIFYKIFPSIAITHIAIAVNTAFIAINAVLQGQQPHSAYSCVMCNIFNLLLPPGIWSGQ